MLLSESFIAALQITPSLVPKNTKHLLFPVSGVQESGSGSAGYLQLRISEEIIIKCQLGLQSSKGFTEAGGSSCKRSSLSWLLAGGLFLPQGTLAKTVHRMAAHFPQSRESQRERQKPLCLLYMLLEVTYHIQYNFGSDFGYIS